MTTKEQATEGKPRSGKKQRQELTRRNQEIHNHSSGSIKLTYIHLQLDGVRLRGDSELGEKTTQLVLSLLVLSSELRSSRCSDREDAEGEALVPLVQLKEIGDENRESSFVVEPPQVDDRVTPRQSFLLSR